MYEHLIHVNLFLLLQVLAAVVDNLLPMNDDTKDILTDVLAVLNSKVCSNLRESNMKL